MLGAAASARWGERKGKRTGIVGVDDELAHAALAHAKHAHVPALDDLAREQLEAKAAARVKHLAALDRALVADRDGAALAALGALAASSE